MEPQQEKLRVSVIDFLPHHGKLSCHAHDKNNLPLFYGDTVKHFEKQWIVAYRYGKPMLKQIGTLFSLICDLSTVEKLPTVFTAGEDWLLIGYADEPIWNEVRKLTL